MNDQNAGFQLSLKLHNELERLYLRVEQHGARFRSFFPADPRFPRPPGITPGVRLDPVACALAVKAATTKRAILALCQMGDGDNALVLARVILENACLLEWLIRGSGRRRLEGYVLFLSVAHERIVETINRHRKRFAQAGAGAEVDSSSYHQAVWRTVFQDSKGKPTRSDRPTWNFDDTRASEPVSVKAMFQEIAGEHSFEHDVLYGALGSDIVHSGPFSLARIEQTLVDKKTFTLGPCPSRELCTIALASSNTAMFLVLDSLTQYIGLNLSAELDPLRKQAATDPYAMAAAQADHEAARKAG